MDLAEDVRMTVDEFVAQTVDHVHDIVFALLGSYLRIEDDVQQHVAQFLGDFPAFPAEDGVAQFVSLLNRLRTQRLGGLLVVPGAFLPELVHYIQKAAESLQLGLPR